MNKMPQAMRPPNAEAMAAEIVMKDIRSPISSRLYLEQMSAFETPANERQWMHPPVRQHQSQAWEQESFKHAQEQPADSQSRKILHKAIREANNSPAQSCGGNNDIEA